MFPRNKRKIEPWWLSQVLGVFDYISASEGDLISNQLVQERFADILDTKGLKSGGYRRDPAGGGTRTYLAQLECLGLLFKRDSSYLYTLAGEKILNADEPLGALQTAILRHQYPSPYGSGRQVKINQHLAVKPFVFLLQLMLDADIGYLTDFEIRIPCIYGHNHDCLELCKQKILRLRDGARFESVVDHEYEDTYTPQRKKKGFDDFEEYISHIANTCRNYFQSSRLICADEEHSDRFVVAEGLHHQIQGAIDSIDVFIPNSDNPESFQRAYGCYGREKDTRRFIENAGHSRAGEETVVTQEFIQWSSRFLFPDHDDFRSHIGNEYGIADSVIDEVLRTFSSRSFSLFETEYLRLSTGGKELATDFEIATGSLLEKKLFFEVHHTGQRKRPNRDDIGGYSDLFVVALDRKNCAIVDTKASPSYSLSSSDCSKMDSNYIANYRELTDGRDLNLEFCAYVAGGFTQGINSLLKRLTKDTGVPISAIDANNLFDLTKKNISKEDQVAIRRKFRSGRRLSSGDFKA